MQAGAAGPRLAVGACVQRSVRTGEPLMRGLTQSAISLFSSAAKPSPRSTWSRYLAARSGAAAVYGDEQLPLVICRGLAEHSSCMRTTMMLFFFSQKGCQGRARARAPIARHGAVEAGRAGDGLEQEALLRQHCCHRHVPAPVKCSSSTRFAALTPLLLPSACMKVLSPIT